ncbi:MAG: cytochrome c oxidase subunit II [Lentisphaeria bacterium]|nr:cytochrome c oxidase subunit II [Lentisphaeria bacterium]
MPEQASTVAAEVDNLYWFIHIVCVIFFIIITAGTMYFAFKYQGKGPIQRTIHFTHNLYLEITWTLIPTIIIFFMFIWGFELFIRLYKAPANAMEVRVIGQRWNWSFYYPQTGKQSSELVVPTGKPVKLIITSNDVLHSVFIPDFRVKIDAVPNRYTSLWFEALITEENKEGIHDMYCAEYCGKDHSKMYSLVKVVSPAEFTTWVNDVQPRMGKDLYTALGCNSCHTLDGTKPPGGGPSWKGLYDIETRALEKNKTRGVDRNYLEDSIKNPQMDVVPGYEGVTMPGFAHVKEAEIQNLITFILEQSERGKKELEELKKQLPAEEKSKEETKK